MYIFWDNSNIHYAGLDHVFPSKEPGEKGNCIGHTSLIYWIWFLMAEKLKIYFSLVVSRQKATHYGDTSKALA